MQAISFSWATEEELKRLPGILDYNSKLANALCHDRKNKGRNSFFVAKDGNRVIGYVVFEQDYLNRIFVKGKYRGKLNLFRRLLSKSLKNQFEKNPAFDSIAGILDADNSNEQNCLERGFESVGFSQVGNGFFSVSRSKFSAL